MDVVAFPALLRREYRKRAGSPMLAIVAIVSICMADNARSENIIQNGSFENGTSQWILNDVANPIAIPATGGTPYNLAVRPAGQTPLPSTFPPGAQFFKTTPTDGSKVIGHGFSAKDGTPPGNIEIAQDVTIDADSTATLTFDYRAAWNFGPAASSGLEQTFDVAIEPAGGGAALLTQNLLSVNAANAFVSDTGSRTASVDLSQLAGQAIRVKLRASVVGLGNTGHLQIDNVALNVKPAEAAVRERTARGIKNFASSRAKQITSNELDFTDRLSSTALHGATGPATFTGSGDAYNNRMAFKTSLRQIQNSGQDAEKAQHAKDFSQMMSLGAQSAAGGASPPTAFDIWVRGNWARYENTADGGDFGMMFVGADYRFHNDLVFGVVSSFDWTDEEDKVNGLSVEGGGGTIGPYIAGRLHHNLLFDGRIAYGRSDNKISPYGTHKDSFDGSRWLVAGKFTGDFKFGNRNNFTFAPHVGIVYFEEKQNSYADSLSISIPNQTVKLGRLTYGPKISTGLQTKDGTAIVPYLGVKGIFDIKTADEVDLNAQFAGTDADKLRARIDGGLSIVLTSGMLLNGEAFYDGIGSDESESYGGSVAIRVPLQSASSNGARLNLGINDSNNTQQDGYWQANKRVKIDDGNLGDHAAHSAHVKNNNMQQ